MGPVRVNDKSRVSVTRGARNTRDVGRREVPRKRVVQVGGEARSGHELARPCSFSPEFKATRRRRLVPVSRFCCELRYAFAKALAAWALGRGAGIG